MGLDSPGHRAARRHPDDGRGLPRAGLGVLPNLPAELNPKVDFPRHVDSTTYAGTNPQEMETLITKPIEDAISGVSGIQEIDSYSQQGVPTVSIQFYFGTNLDTAVVGRDPEGGRDPQGAARRRRRARRHQGGHQRPADHAHRDGEQPALPARPAVHGDQHRPARAGAGHRCRLGQRRRRPPRARSASRVPADRLAAYGITISQLSQAIQNANVNVSSGFIQTRQPVLQRPPGRRVRQRGRDQEPAPDVHRDRHGVGQRLHTDERQRMSRSANAGATGQTIALGDIADGLDTGRRRRRTRS